jgi:hypothetical protein
LYRLYIIVGLPMMIALTVFIMLRSDPYEPEILPILAPVLVWVAGLLILQWISLLSDGVGPVAPEGEELLPGTDDPPLDREALRTVLRVGGRYASSAPTPPILHRKGLPPYHGLHDRAPRRRRPVHDRRRRGHHLSPRRGRTRDTGVRAPGARARGHRCSPPRQPVPPGHQSGRRVVERPEVARCRPSPTGRRP